jgi:hypothetical protein
VTALLCDRLQQTVYRRLETEERLATQLAGIYDEVPEGAALPCLTMGETTMEGADLKDIAGTNITFTLFILSDEPGQMQVKELMAAVDECLNRFVPAVPGARAGELMLTNAGVTRQFTENGSRYRGRMAYRVKLYEDAQA